VYIYTLHFTIDEEWRMIESFVYAKKLKIASVREE